MWPGSAGLRALDGLAVNAPGGSELPGWTGLDDREVQGRPRVIHGSVLAEDLAEVVDKPLLNLVGFVRLLADTVKPVARTGRRTPRNSGWSSSDEGSWRWSGVHQGCVLGHSTADVPMVLQ